MIDDVEGLEGILGSSRFGSTMFGSTAFGFDATAFEFTCLDEGLDFLAARGIFILPSWFPNPNRSSNPPPVAALGERLIVFGLTNWEDGSTAGFGVGDEGCGFIDFTIGFVLEIVERRMRIFPVRDLVG